MCKILALGGAIFVYMKWMNREVKWKYYRFQKAVLCFLAGCLWLGLNTFLILWQELAGNELVLSVINGFFFFLLLGILTEESLYKKGKLFAAFVLLESFTGALSVRVYQLGVSIFAYDNARRQGMLAVLCGIGFVAMQELALYYRKQYQEKQAAREKCMSEALAMQENMKFQEKQYEDMAEVYEEVKKLRHDMQNSFLLIYELLMEGHIEEAKKYLHKENEELSKIPSIVQTESVVISTLLNWHLQKTRKQGISVSCKITTSFRGIEERDLCHLLGNLLDNAACAAEKVTDGEKSIDLVIQGDSHQMIIETENSSTGPVRLCGDHWETSKADKENHGFGMKNIKSVVEKYNGSLEIGQLPGRVRIVMLLFRKQ